MTGKHPNQRRGRVIWGIVLLIAGLVYAGVSLGIIQVDSSTTHAPMTVLFLVAVVLSIGGVMMIAGRDSRLNELLAAVLLLGMSSIGSWVAIFGSIDGISGGLAFLPSELNVGLGRVLFGLGALLCLAMAVYALRRALKSKG